MKYTILMLMLMASNVFAMTDYEKSLLDILRFFKNVDYQHVYVNGADTARQNVKKPYALNVFDFVTKREVEREDMKIVKDANAVYQLITSGDYSEEEREQALINFSHVIDLAIDKVEFSSSANISKLNREKESYVKGKRKMHVKDKKTYMNSKKKTMNKLRDENKENKKIIQELKKIQILCNNKDK